MYHLEVFSCVVRVRECVREKVAILLVPGCGFNLTMGEEDTCEVLCQLEETSDITYLCYSRALFGPHSVTFEETQTVSSLGL